MESEEKSVMTLIQDLCSSVWTSENVNLHESFEPNSEQPKHVRKKMQRSCFKIFLKQKHLWTDKHKSNGEISISYRLFLHFYKSGLCDENDKEVFNEYSQSVEHLVKKYEAAEAVFGFLAALSDSKPRKKIKPSEMLNCFYFGTLRHCVPPHQRSQTLQDQFDMLRPEPSARNVLSTSSRTDLNPFRIRRHFDFSIAPILVQAPVLNASVPRSLNLVEPNSQPVHQDEGYVTPGSANILDDDTGQSNEDQIPPCPREPVRPCPSSWNTLANVSAPGEKSFVLDFDLAVNTERTGKHLVQVLQSGKEAPSPTETRLFTHERGGEEFTRDLKYLLVGTPSQCFPFDEDKNQFSCAYGIYTAHVSPEFLFRYLEPALQCGNHAYMLKHLPRSKKKGSVYLSFLHCVQEYLRRYDTQVLSHLTDNSSWHYIELQDFVTAQLHRLSCLSHLYKPDSHLLNHIYAQMLDSCVTGQSAELTVMVARIFECCTNTHFELLEKWLFRGDCHESLVTQSSCHSFKSRLFWARGFRFNRAQNPVFLEDYEDQIFACGKNICLLKLTNPEDPLFSVDFARIPRLKCYLTRESLQQFHAQCREYEAAAIEACGEAPQFAALLMPQQYSLDQLRQWQEQARAKQEIYVQKQLDERLKKRELQAEQRRKMRLEIESVEARKKEEREKEMEVDRKIMEEARRLDEEYWQVKEEEKRKIEEYYSSLMRIIEKRHEYVKSKTQSLEEMKTLLRKKVSREKLGADATDGKTELQSIASEKSPAVNDTTSFIPSLSESTASSVPSSEELTDPELFSLDIPEPPNVELLMRKIEEEEEVILLTRETQKRLDALKCNRLQARANRNRVLSCEFDICTGEVTAKPSEPFDLREKYMEGNTAHADEEAVRNKARAQGGHMSDCLNSFNPGTTSKTGEDETGFSRNQAETVPDRDRKANANEKQRSKKKSSTVDSIEEEDEPSLKEKSKSPRVKSIQEENEPYSMEKSKSPRGVSNTGERTSDARQTALLIKQKILSAEFDIRTTRDTADGTTHDDNAEGRTCGGVAGTTRDRSVAGKQVLGAHEEALRNKNKVMAHEYHMRPSQASTDVRGRSKSENTSCANQEAGRNRDRSCSGSDMGHCMRNDERAEIPHTEESNSGVNQEARQNRDRSRSGSDMGHCMRNDGRAEIPHTEECTSGVNQEARRNRDRSCSGSGMGQCMRNDGRPETTHTEESNSGVNQEARRNRDRSRSGSDMGHCMRNDGRAETTSSKLALASISSNPKDSTQESEDPVTEDPVTEDPTTENGAPSQSTTSSSENLVTIISQPDADETSRASDSKRSCELGFTRAATETAEHHIGFTRAAKNPKTAEYNINPTWSFDSLIDETRDLDVTLVQKYLERSVAVPLSIQYRLTNHAVLRLFLHKHHLAAHLITLRNYFFLLDGSFARSLTRDLSRQIRSNAWLLLNPFKLNSILRKAVGHGACDTKMQNNLTFVVRNVETISCLQESNVFQYISLSYKVDWPLNIVLTPEALANYDKVFVFLMQVQQASHTLQQVFVYLKLRKYLETNNLYIYRQINLFRHVMMQVLSAVQSYIHCSVLELPWQEMVEAFQKPVTLDSLYYRHVEYVKQIRFRCLLNNRSRPLTEALGALFKTILDFYEELKRRSPEKNYENLLSIFQRFLKISLYFHDYCKRMVVKGYQEQNLDYLLHMLSLNDYFSRSIQ